MAATKMLVVLAALALVAVPVCMAADVDVENAAVGSELSGRKLMRNLMGGEWGDDWGKKDDYKKDDYKKDYYKKDHHWKKPKYVKKTCYATTSTQKDPTTSTTEKVHKYYKYKTYEKVKTIPVTTYTYSTYDKVVKKPKYKKTYYTSTTTYAPVYSTYPVEYYKKKGWGHHYNIPKECQTEPPPEEKGW